jgi:hypothetical protein
MSANNAHHYVAKDANFRAYTFVLSLKIGVRDHCSPMGSTRERWRIKDP